MSRSKNFSQWIKSLWIFHIILQEFLTWHLTFLLLTLSLQKPLNIKNAKSWKLFNAKSEIPLKYVNRFQVFKCECWAKFFGYCLLRKSHKLSRLRSKNFCTQVQCDSLAESNPIIIPTSQAHCQDTRITLLQVKKVWNNRLTLVWWCKIELELCFQVLYTCSFERSNERNFYFIVFKTWKNYNNFCFFSTKVSL